jgi:NAD(P)-dependent dehydrogenase (short-subunit alcohol dehydrogenase family)
MKGKTVVVTGGTSGIGEIAAERLAQMGARIVLIARDKSRGEATLARLHERAPSLGHAVHYADLARIPEMKCQSASDRDPRSASNRDPLVLRFGRLALAPSELVGVAETGRARVGV